MKYTAADLFKRTQRLIAALRTDDPALTARVKNGKYQIVRVTYKSNGASVVLPESAWLPIADLPA